MSWGCISNNFGKSYMEFLILISKQLSPWTTWTHTFTTGTPLSWRALVDWQPVHWWCAGKREFCNPPHSLQNQHYPSRLGTASSWLMSLQDGRHGVTIWKYHGKSIHYALNERLGGPQCQPGHYEENENLLFLPEINPNSSVIQCVGQLIYQLGYPGSIYNRQ